MTTSRSWHLAARPVGEPTLEDFALVASTLADPGEGEVLIRNTALSVDPYMRGRMSAAKSYADPYRVGEAMWGGAVGAVVASRFDGISVGDTVLHGLGWREHSVVPGSQAQVVDTSDVPDSAYLGVLGMPGLTAWVGLFEIAQLKAGETVFVSGAAGAVGSLVGQLAKLRGATVIGSAGSPEKVRWLTGQLGFDAAFDYKAGPVAAQLAAAAPEGIDVYFDNVGGEHLEAAIGALKPFGRAAICGMISRYNDASPQPGPANLPLLVAKRLRLQGFLVFDHAHHTPQFLAEVGPALADGRLQARETVVHGIEQMAPAFLGLLRGDNTGKMVVRLSAP